MRLLHLLYIWQDAALVINILALQGCCTRFEPKLGGTLRQAKLRWDLPEGVTFVGYHASPEHYCSRKHAIQSYIYSLIDLPSYRTPLATRWWVSIIPNEAPLIAGYLLRTSPSEMSIVY